ncbi:hypothetical protein [Myxococcus fulvus]|uniref:hypothetical protein n=1 Tax=Myxococcus fulvus TaxID=33 RepID=UPI0020C16ECD|nr:hypothetical protein [Myxococcus fulvus]MCK8497232.1 hypothetical protein [Myxococcus fulvus]
MTIQSPPANTPQPPVIEPFRKIWDRNSTTPPSATEPAINEFCQLEAEARALGKLSFEAAKKSHGIDIVEPLASLLVAAETDLIAGCDLARHGYLKQAYALWRSWFEELLIATYFVEAPIVRLAWKTVEEITKPGKRPPISLMSHQLLVTSGDKAHPFAIAYEERFKRLLDALKISQLPKDRYPLTLAEHTITDLSQGVHGTYRPPPINSAHQLPTFIAKHVNPIFRRTSHLAGLFLFTLIHSSTSISEEILIKMTNNSYAPTETSDEESTLLPLIPQLNKGIALLKEKE